MTTKFITDNENYGRPDSGCEVASHLLGHQSHCQECPFGKCIYDTDGRGRPRNTERDREIVSSDKTIKELSIKYNLAERTIKGIIKKGMNDGS